MTNFILISAAIVAAALLMLAPTLLRRANQPHANSDTGPDTREYNIRIARERLAELEKEHTKGELSAEEFNQAKQDLQIALAQDLSTSPASVTPAQSNNKNTNRITLAVLVLLVPALVIGLYQYIGAPQHLELRGPGQPVAQKTPPIEELVAALEKRLQQQPDNAQGWFLLGNTYMRLGRYADAVRTYATLHQRQPQDAAIKLSLADALAMQNGGNLNERAVQLLEQALVIEPNSATTLWLLGQAAIQNNQPKQALDYWQRAHPMLSEQPQEQQQLGKMIAQLQDQTGLAAQPPVTPPTLVAQPGLTVSVTLDAAWQDKASPQDAVFIYAKALNGPPMPLAVARKTVAELPVQVRLNDNMAMMPQMKLSNFDRVLVGARVSKTGQAIPQTGDLQSEEVEVANDQAGVVKLVIDRIKG